MIALLAQGLSLGLSASLAPGPFQAFLANRAGRAGTARTLPLATAPLLSDAPIVVLVLFALTALPESFLLVLRVAGGAVMIYLGSNSILALRRAGARTGGARTAGEGRGSERESGERGGFGRALLLNALSPGPYLFWSVLAGPIVVEAWRDSQAAALAFVFAFYLTLVGGFMAVVVLFGLLAKGGVRLTRVVVTVTGAALIGFGIYQILQGLGVA
ncbi:MAG: LysE family transporter [Spirochaetes bacterium]|jgi:threonine/homoserine/homoserine lactone efflux protein|nr:LysE family transporter [Spirochaetota bacterium]